MNIVTCDVCFGHYGAMGRCPRLFTCGHTICSPCSLVYVLVNTMATCPFCSRGQPATPPEVPVEPFPTHPSPAERRPSSGPELPASGTLRRITVPNLCSPPNWCERHGIQRQAWCATCRVWLCRDCSLPQHPAAFCCVVPSSASQVVEIVKQLEDEGVMKTVLQTEKRTRLLIRKEEDLMGVVMRHSEDISELRKVITMHERAQRRLKEEVTALQANIVRGVEACVELMGSQRELLQANTAEDNMAIWQGIKKSQTTLQNWYNRILGQDSDDVKSSVRLQAATAECLLLLSRRETDARPPTITITSPNKEQERADEVDGGPAKRDSAAAAVGGGAAAAAAVGGGAAAAAVGGGAAAVVGGGAAAVGGVAAVQVQAAAVEGGAAVDVQPAAVEGGGDEVDHGAAARKRKVARPILHNEPRVVDGVEVDAAAVSSTGVDAAAASSTGVDAEAASSTGVKKVKKRIAFKDDGVDEVDEK